MLLDSVPIKKRAIMGNLLSTYLDKRFIENQPFDKTRECSGPVITISREVGCNALKLARQIAEKLNERKSKNQWRVLSKEVFQESAKELNLDYNRITRVFKNTEKYTFEEILNAFSDRNYKSEKKIVKTVADVIHTFAVNGHCIIVGRAGHIIAKDIKNALHIRLVAPLEYRIGTIMRNNSLNKEQAIDFIKKVEKKRIAFRKALGKAELIEEDFDLILNRASFDNKTIIEIIEKVMSEKNMLTDKTERLILV
jgi:cytidylate kinase